MKFETGVGFLVGTFVLVSKIVFGQASTLLNTYERGSLKPLFETDSSTYLISGNKATHKEAKSECKKYQDYYLVVIENEEERRIIADQLRQIRITQAWVAAEQDENNKLFWSYPNGTVGPMVNQNMPSATDKPRSLRHRRNVLGLPERNLHGSNANPIGHVTCPINVQTECQVKDCNVTVSECSITTPKCTVGPSVCKIDEQPECTASCKNCTIVVQPVCYAQPKPCNVTHTGECTITEASCTVTTPPCTVFRPPCTKPTQPPCTRVSTPAPCTTVEPCIPTNCTNGTCSCPVQICHQEEIICPPVSTHCPPPEIKCPDPIVTCEEPKLVCPEAMAHCPDPDVVCTEAQVHCNAPIINCPPVVHSCAQPKLDCPQPIVTCPPAEVECPDDGDCIPGTVSIPPECTSTTPMPPTTPETCFGCKCCYLDNYYEFLFTNCKEEFHYVCEKRK